MIYGTSIVLCKIWELFRKLICIIMGQYLSYMHIWELFRKSTYIQESSIYLDDKEACYEQCKHEI